MPTVCRFEFKEDVDPETIEAYIALAILVSECVFGKPGVRISAAYYMSREKPQAVIDVTTDVGEHIARVFTGMMMKQLGESSFQVERLYDQEPCEKQ